MRYTTTFMFFFFPFYVKLIVANTQTFSLKLDAPGTNLDGFNLYIDSTNKVLLSKTDQCINATIADDGTLILDSGETMGIGRNFLSTKAISSTWIVAEPWTIENGKLKLYGADFHSLYSGAEDIYVMGSVNAAAGRSDVIEISIIPIKADGTVVADYVAKSVSSSSASSSSFATSSFLGYATSASTSSTEKNSKQSSLEVAKQISYITKNSYYSTESVLTFAGTPENQIRSIIPK
ncbi:unnamed protein product [Kluyveromyces dobzhanskii CBS 2104]|uniref:WGS project CCBQ000000000 data, contig 00006 n=1 Tax=Kluyveromyces dobzhanskii CBS 2104 TaxID=1427455 RepID=A0A0A8LAG5_9SACH|nr:unnamed protein product [Kluyveromyces dobzhanskii CBS 2104]